MNRRTFLRSSGSGLITANLIAPAASLREMSFDNQKRRRVGLIGCGWYGKIDLFRLIQVSPVEVIALCDVDRRMLAEAAGMVATRQASRKIPRTYSRYDGRERVKPAEREGKRLNRRWRPMTPKAQLKQTD